MVSKYRNEYPNSNHVLLDNSHNWSSETLSSLKQVLIGGKKKAAANSMHLHISRCCKELTQVADIKGLVRLLCLYRQKLQ